MIQWQRKYYNQQSTFISALRKFQNQNFMMGSLRNLVSCRMWSQLQSSSGCLQQYLGSTSMHFTSSLEGEPQLNYNIQVDMSSSTLIARKNRSIYQSLNGLIYHNAICISVYTITGRIIYNHKPHQISVTSSIHISPAQ